MHPSNPIASFTFEIWKNDKIKSKANAYPVKDLIPTHIKAITKSKSAWLLNPKKLSLLDRKTDINPEKKIKSKNINRNITLFSIISFIFLVINPPNSPIEKTVLNNEGLMSIIEVLSKRLIKLNLFFVYSYFLKLKLIDIRSKIIDIIPKQTLLGSSFLNSLMNLS